jgi:hypothetical protein
MVILKEDQARGLFHEVPAATLGVPTVLFPHGGENLDCVRGTV